MWWKCSIHYPRCCSPTWSYCGTIHVLLHKWIHCSWLPNLLTIKCWNITVQRRCEKIVATTFRCVTKKTMDLNTRILFYFTLRCLHNNIVLTQESLYWARFQGNNNLSEALTFLKLMIMYLGDLFPAIHQTRNFKITMVGFLPKGPTLTKYAIVFMRGSMVVKTLTRRL